MAHVSFANMEEAGFMTSTTASFQGAIQMLVFFLLLGGILSSMFIYSNSYTAVIWYIYTIKYTVLLLIVLSRTDIDKP